MRTRRSGTLVVLFVLILYSILLFSVLSDYSGEEYEQTLSTVEPAETLPSTPEIKEPPTPVVVPAQEIPSQPEEPVPEPVTKVTPVVIEPSVAEVPETTIEESSPPITEAIESPVVMEMMEASPPLVMETAEDVSLPPAEFVPLPQEEIFVEESIDDDFWSDFYVAGEEAVTLFDQGSFYVPLLVNGEYLNDILVSFEGEEILLSLEELKLLIGDDLIPKVYNAIFSVEGENIALSYLNALGVEGFYDYTTFELSINFETWMLPVRTLSIHKGDVVKYGEFQMSGSQALSPSFFSIFTNISIHSGLSWDTNTPFKINPADIFTLQGRGSMAIWDLSFDFSYMLHPGRGYSDITDSWSDQVSDYITWGGFQGFYDFIDTSVRFSFGNVTDYLGLSRDSVGFGIEKRYSYGTSEPKAHQFNYEIVVTEPAVVEVFINEKSIYRREVAAGNYNLQDFIFSQGTNASHVIVTSVQSEEVLQEYYFDLTFDSRLMSLGDTLYSASITSPRASFTPRFRLSQRYGLSNELTGGYTVAASTEAFYTGVDAVIATRAGTVNAQMAASLNSPLGFGYAATASMNVSMKKELPFLSSLSFSFSYSDRRFTTAIEVPSTMTPGTGDILQGSVSFAGLITDYLRYSLSTNISWYTNQSDITVRSSLSGTFSLIPNLALNASVNFLKNTVSTTPILTYQIGASYTISKDASVSASTNLVDSSFISGSVKPFGSDSDSLRFSFSGLTLSDFLNHQGSLYYTHTGNSASYNISGQYADTFQSYSLSFNLTTALAYANGLFGISRSISDNFFLVKPGGAMSNQDVAVTRTMTTDPERLSTFFGTSLYTSLSSHQENNLVVYGIGDELLSSSESFIYSMTPRPRQGYAVRVSSQMAYSVVGNLLRDPSHAFDRYTVDIAKVEIDENGGEILMMDETIYLFTDENGFYFMSGLTAGLYQFSIFLPGSLEDDPPVDVRFTVEEIPDVSQPMVIVLDTFIASEIAARLEEEEFERNIGNEVADPLLSEEGYYDLPILDVIQESEFWETYYPQRLVVGSPDFNEALPGSDAYVERIPQSGSLPASALADLMSDNPSRLVNLTRLRNVVFPLIEATAPVQFNLTGDVLKPMF